MTNTNMLGLLISIWGFLVILNFQKVKLFIQCSQHFFETFIVSLLIKGRNGAFARLSDFNPDHIIYPFSLLKLTSLPLNFRWCSPAYFLNLFHPLVLLLNILSCQSRWLLLLHLLCHCEGVHNTVVVWSQHVITRSVT